MVYINHNIKMPKAKNKRKNGRVAKRKQPQAKVIDFKSLSGLEQWRALHNGDAELPKCKICGADTEFASEQDVMEYKKYDTTYQFNFIISPKCDCWQTNEEWMD